MKLYRFCIDSYSALDGEGAYRSAQRFNRRKERVIYTGGTKSICLLEKLVHFERNTSKAKWMFVEIEFIEEVPILEFKDEASFEYRSDLNSKDIQKCQEFGSRILQIDHPNSILKYPSAIIDSEYNFAFNPRLLTMYKHRVTLTPFNFEALFLNRFLLSFK